MVNKPNLRPCLVRGNNVNSTSRQMLCEFVGARMADRTRRLPQNIAGDFFVDDSCIDCDTCRQLAPAHFRDHGDQSSVYLQPETTAEISQALKALVSCPTAFISFAKGDCRLIADRGMRASASLRADTLSR